MPQNKSFGFDKQVSNLATENFKQKLILKSLYTIKPIILEEEFMGITYLEKPTVDICFVL